MLSLLLSRGLPESQRVDLVDLLGEIHLLLLVDEAEARFAHQTVNYFQVPADATVHLVRDHTFVRHVVLDDDEAVWAQCFLAAL